ncbi:DUF4389 domain-containing protein [Streptomyces sp. NPDC050264]|uniref:DUF4389 domain-containing protein n=1 Tax=Streptomyces sp. NPDC050264 TaxID=3155038 RepID=UPI003447B7C0
MSTATATVPSVYSGEPVTLEADYEPTLSRRLWLVKRLLVIPHHIALPLLFIALGAFGIVSVIAWFAILFTARFPKALFDFNVGVPRWGRRVACYAYGSLGAASPARLSRGLVALLTFFSGVALLFTGSYPHGMHDLNLAPHRWAARVIVHTAPMADVYPPFRLDQGAREPQFA